jgi:hypothetical protein
LPISVSSRKLVVEIDPLQTRIFLYAHRHASAPPRSR